MRTIIDLPDHQLEELSLLCEKHNISRAEAIRRAVQAMLDRVNNDSARIALDAVYGIWKHRVDIDDSIEYQRKLEMEL